MGLAGVEGGQRAGVALVAPGEAGSGLASVGKLGAIRLTAPGGHRPDRHPPDLERNYQKTP